MTRCLLLAAVLLAAYPCAANTLRVGPDAQYKTLDVGLKAAADGDTVEIEAGEYFECARVTADHLTIVGLDAGATLSDTTCDGKAQLVVKSNDVTIRNITFTRARVNDGNGAGIRAEGRDLTIDHARFINNQSAILAASSPHSVITIKNSQFDENGACAPDGRCVSTVQVGDIARLRVETSTLTGARGGYLLLSSARRTELYGNTLSDGPKGQATGLVQASIGSLVMEDNRLQKRAPYTNRAAAIFVLPSDVPLGELVMRRTIYIDDSGADSALMIDYSGAALRASDNVMPAGVDEFSRAGIVRYRVGNAYRDSKAALLDAARFLKQNVKILLGR